MPESEPLNRDIVTRLESLERRISILEDKISHGDSFTLPVSKSSIEEENIVSKIDSIGTQTLVVIALKLFPGMSKLMVMEKLTDWGKTFGIWFKGGNLNNRLIKKGIVKVDRTERGEDAKYYLTKKGELMANSLLEKVKSL